MYIEQLENIFATPSASVPTGISISNNTFANYKLRKIRDVFDGKYKSEKDENSSLRNTLKKIGHTN